MKDIIGLIEEGNARIQEYKRYIKDIKQEYKNIYLLKEGVNLQGYKEYSYKLKLNIKEGR